MRSIIPYSQILIVEDEDDTSTLIKSILDAHRLEAHTFKDPFLALAVFKDDPISYSLIIYDMTIKQLSAFEFLRQARDDNPDIKFLLITTIEIKPDEFSKMLPTINVDGFIEKQSLSKQIMPAINKVLGSRKIAKSNIGKYR